MQKSTAEAKAKHAPKKRPAPEKDRDETNSDDEAPAAVDEEQQEEVATKKHKQAGKKSSPARPEKRRKHADGKESSISSSSSKAAEAESADEDGDGAAAAPKKAKKPQHRKLNRLLDGVAEGTYEIAADKIKVPRAKKTATASIRRMQTSDAPVFPTASMKRAIRDTICTDKCAMRITGDALLMAQSGIEAFMCRHLKKAKMVSGHAHRATVTLPDIEFSSLISGPHHF
jgi:histone H3/H4